MDTAVTEKVNSQEKLNWSNVMLDDVVGTISSNEQFKIFLIFRNQKWTTDTNLVENVVEEMYERAKKQNTAAYG